MLNDPLISELRETSRSGAPDDRRLLVRNRVFVLRSKYRLVRPHVIRLSLILASLPILFVILRPDWYNHTYGLDQYFYTGYTQNLGNAVALVGDSWYFTTRWSLYLPEHAFFVLFGPATGYLLFRFVTVSALIVCLYACGQRWWRRLSVTVLVMFVCVVNPMILRSIFTDHAEAVILPLSVVAMTCVALKPASISFVAGGGLALGLAIAAQPFAASIVVSIVVSAAMTSWGTWPLRLRQLAVLATGASAALAFGLAWFRIIYGIPNVYAPTVDFLRSHEGYVDPLRASNLDWLAYKLWIYLPALMLGIALAAHFKRVWQFSKGELFVLRCCGLQYLFQWWYEFARNGPTLELPWYWSYMLPSFLLASAVVIGKLADHVRDRDVWVLLGVLVVALLAFPRPFPAVGSWVYLAMLLAIGIGVGWRLRERLPDVLLCIGVTAVIFVPMAAPRSPTTQVAGIDFDNDYELVFKSSSSPGQDAFESVTWFLDETSVLDTDVQRRMFFWVGGGLAHQFAAMYEAHVTGRWFNAGWGLTVEEKLSLSDANRQRIAAGEVQFLVLIGLPDEVARMARELAQAGMATETLIDDVAPSETGTHVKVVEVSPITT